MKNTIQSVPFRGTTIVQLTKGGKWYLFLQDFVMSAKDRNEVCELGNTFISNHNLQVLDRDSYAAAIVEYLEDYPKPS